MRFHLNLASGIVYLSYGDVGGVCLFNTLTKVFYVLGTSINSVSSALVFF